MDGLIALMLLMPWLICAALCFRKAWRKGAERRARNRELMAAYRRAECPFN